MAISQNPSRRKSPVRPAQQNTVFPPFPATHVFNGKHFLVRAEAEAYKRRLARMPPVEAPPDKIEFVSLKAFADELGVCLMTVKRRMQASRRASPKPRVRDLVEV